MRFNRLIFSTFLLIALTGLASAQTNDWLRSAGSIPAGAVEAGNEDDKRQTYVCRASSSGRYMSGKALDDRCYYNSGNREISTSRFDLLVGTGFSWTRSKSSSRAVIVGGTDEENSYVCRVAVSRGVYPGRTEDGRCYYTRNNRGYSSRSYETLEGSRSTTSLLTAASRGNYQDVRDALRDGQAVNQRDSSGKTALMLAAEGGYEQVVREILRERPEINAIDKSGNTAMIYAARKGDYRIFEDLFRAGGNPRVRNESGESAFSAAAGSGQIAIVRLFLDDSRFGGVDELEQANAMNMSAFNGRNEMLELFIGRGINPDTRDAYGVTPLMKAASAGKRDTIKFLLNKDANVNAVDNNGISPFLYAVMSDSDKTVRFFVEDEQLVPINSVQAGEGLIRAALENKRDSMEYLLKTGVDVDYSSESRGVTALMLAAGEGHENATEMLVKFKADLNRQSSDGRTALMRAAAESKKNTTKVLIKAGANLDIRDQNGTTALGWAIRNDHKDTRKELQKAGAKQ